MKRYLIITAAFLAVIFGTAFDLLSETGKAGYTGSPGELLCNDCHGNASTGAIYLTTNLPNGQYIPGQTYTISATVKETARPLFGFAVEALTTANANAGTIVVTNPTQTHVLLKTVGLITRRNITHQQNGGLSNDSAVFTFNWVAPATNIGNITFYYAGVAANNNGNDDANDHTYHGSLVATPGSATALNEIVKSTNGLKIITIAAERKLLLSFSSNSSAKADITIYDLNGRLVSTMQSVSVAQGNINIEMNLPAELQNGIYIVKVNSGQQELSNKTTVLL